MYIQPVTLHGHIVRLEPLVEKHIPDLARVGLVHSIWTYTVYGYIETEKQMRDWVREILHRQEHGTDLPFAVIHLESGRAIGSTRYMNVDINNRSLEIGGTWYGVDYQRTAVNTESKFLLLRHAFEDMGCIRVQLKTDSRNIRSQRAIERLGAVKEGVFRNHMILQDGTRRDSVYYSIIDSEWEEVKTHLVGLMERKPY
jgi:RimJ/RimL family protein N-acetyltransferase